MRDKTKQGIAVRIQPETYARLAPAARHLGWSITSLTNYILNDFVSSRREIRVAMPAEEELKPKPAPTKSLPAHNPWLDDDDEDEFD